MNKKQLGDPYSSKTENHPNTLLILLKIIKNSGKVHKDRKIKNSPIFQIARQKTCLYKKYCPNFQLLLYTCTGNFWRQIVKHWLDIQPTCVTDLD